MIDFGQGVSQLILVLVFYVVVIAAAVWLIDYLFPPASHIPSEKPRSKADSPLSGGVPADRAE